MTDTAAREFSTVGVIGLGTMGAGIAEVFARNGYSVIGVELNDGGVERGRQHLEHSTGRAVKREKMTEEQQAELLGRITLTTDMTALSAADLVVEAVVESLAIKKSIFAKLDGIVRDDAILATNTSSLSVTEISTANSMPGRVIGVHFFNPAPGAEPRRDHPHRRHRACRPRAGAGRAARPRQEPGRLRRQGRLHRQHPALRLPQPRRGDVRGQVRLARGHRRRHALRVRLPDGSARAARPDRARHGLRDPRHDVQAGSRPAARAGADPQAVRHRRPARSQVGSRLLHLRGPRQPRRRGRRPDAERGRQAAPAPRHPVRRRRRHRHDGRGHRRGVRQGGPRRALHRPRPGQGRRRRRHHHQELRQADPARARHRGAEGRGARSGARHHLARRPPRRRPGRGGHRRGPGDQDDALREPRRDLQAWLRSSRPPRRRCRSSRWPRSPSARRTSSACTSSTPRRS